MTDKTWVRDTQNFSDPKLFRKFHKQRKITYTVLKGKGFLYEKSLDQFHIQKEKQQKHKTIEEIGGGRNESYVVEDRRAPQEGDKSLRIIQLNEIIANSANTYLIFQDIMDVMAAL